MEMMDIYNSGYRSKSLFSDRNVSRCFNNLGFRRFSPCREAQQTQTNTIRITTDTVTDTNNHTNTVGTVIERIEEEEESKSFAFAFFQRTLFYIVKHCMFSNASIEGSIRKHRRNTNTAEGTARIAPHLLICSGCRGQEKFAFLPNIATRIQEE